MTIRQSPQSRALGNGLLVLVVRVDDFEMALPCVGHRTVGEIGASCGVVAIRASPLHGDEHPILHDQTVVDRGDRMEAGDPENRIAEPTAQLRDRCAQIERHAES